MHDATCQGEAFFKCDFCRQPWTDERPMVEGHHGSLICGKCLSVAYQDVVLNGSPTAEPGAVCVMCLEERDQPGWRSPIYAEAVICLRCIKQSATVFEKDKDLPWRRPVASKGNDRHD